MTFTFQVILVIAIIISICGVIGSDKSEGLRDHLTAIGIASILSLLATLLFL